MAGFGITSVASRAQDAHGLIDSFTRTPTAYGVEGKTSPRIHSVVDDILDSLPNSTKVPQLFALRQELRSIKQKSETQAGAEEQQMLTEAIDVHGPSREEARENIIRKSMQLEDHLLRQLLFTLNSHYHMVGELVEQLDAKDHLGDTQKYIELALRTFIKAQLPEEGSKARKTRLATMKALRLKESDPSIFPVGTAMFKNHTVLQTARAICHYIQYSGMGSEITRVEEINTRLQRQLRNPSIGDSEIQNLLEEIYSAFQSATANSLERVRTQRTSLGDAHLAFADVQRLKSMTDIVSRTLLVLAQPAKVPVSDDEDDSLRSSVVTTCEQKQVVARTLNSSEYARTVAALSQHRLDHLNWQHTYTLPPLSLTSPNSWMQGLTTFGRHVGIEAAYGAASISVRGFFYFARGQSRKHQSLVQNLNTVAAEHGSARWSDTINRLTEAYEQSSWLNLFSWQYKALARRYGRTIVPLTDDCDQLIDVLYRSHKILANVNAIIGKVTRRFDKLTPEQQVKFVRAILQHQTHKKCMVISRSGESVSQVLLERMIASDTHFDLSKAYLANAAENTKVTIKELIDTHNRLAKKHGNKKQQSIEVKATQAPNLQIYATISTAHNPTDAYVDTSTKRNSEFQARVSNNVADNLRVLARPNVKAQLKASDQPASDSLAHRVAYLERCYTKLSCADSVSGINQNQLHDMQLVIQQFKTSERIRQLENAVLNNTGARKVYGDLVRRLSVDLEAAEMLSTNNFAAYSQNGTLTSGLLSVCAMPVPSALAQGLINGAATAVKVAAEYKKYYDALSLSGLTLTGSARDLFVKQLVLNIAYYALVQAEPGLAVGEAERFIEKAYARLISLFSQRMNEDDKFETTEDLVARYFDLMRRSEGKNAKVRFRLNVVQAHDGDKHIRMHDLLEAGFERYYSEHCSNIRIVKGDPNSRTGGTPTIEVNARLRLMEKENALRKQEIAAGSVHRVKIEKQLVDHQAELAALRVQFHQETEQRTTLEKHSLHHLDRLDTQAANAEQQRTSLQEGLGAMGRRVDDEVIDRRSLEDYTLRQLTEVGAKAFDNEHELARKDTVISQQQAQLTTQADAFQQLFTEFSALKDNNAQLRSAIAEMRQQMSAQSRRTDTAVRATNAGQPVDVKSLRELLIKNAELEFKLEFLVKVVRQIKENLNAHKLEKPKNKSAQLPRALSDLPRATNVTYTQWLGTLLECLEMYAEASPYKNINPDYIFAHNVNEGIEKLYGLYFNQKGELQPNAAIMKQQQLRIALCVLKGLGIFAKVFGEKEARAQKDLLAAIESTIKKHEFGIDPAQYEIFKSIGTSLVLPSVPITIGGLRITQAKQSLDAYSQRHSDYLESESTALILIPELASGILAELESYYSIHRCYPGHLTGFSAHPEDARIRKYLGVKRTIHMLTKLVKAFESETRDMNSAVGDMARIMEAYPGGSKGFMHQPPSNLMMIIQSRAAIVKELSPETAAADANRLSLAHNALGR